MELIRFLIVAAMLAALFVFANLHAVEIVGSSLNLFFSIAVAALWTKVLLLAA